MIPDSGTTLLMGPKKQAEQLEASVCDEWDRCKELQAKAPLALNDNDKSYIFRKLLLDCNTWLTEAKGLHEIPSLFFHVRGRDNSTQVFELTAWAWITETTYINVQQESTYLVDAEMASLLSTGNRTDGAMRVCTSIVGSSGGPDYITEKNGPVWIMGTPLFYEYDVGYDHATMSVALQKGLCAGCESRAALMSTEEEEYRSRGRPRFVDARPRVPQYDISLPL